MECNEYIKKLKAFAGKISKTHKALLLVLIIGITILLCPKNDEVNDPKVMELSADATENHINDLEASLSEIISAITGEKEIKIMITAEASKEKVYAKELIKGNNETEEEYVIVKNSSQSQSALVIKEIEPRIKGAVVVTNKADNPIVKEKIIDAVMKALGIGASQISVVSCA